MGETQKNLLVIHCADTPPSWMEGKGIQAQVREIRRWHVEERGWSDIAYNFVGGRGGEVMGGRDLDHDGDFWEEIGAGVKGHNTGAIHFCLVGGKGSTANDAFGQHFTPAQDVALREFIAKAKARYPGIRVAGHNEFAQKACPGFNVGRWLANKAPARASVTESAAVRTGAAGVATTATGAITAVSALEGVNQTVALVFCGLGALLFLYMIRDRVQKWARGVK